MEKILGELTLDEIAELCENHSCSNCPLRIVCTAEDSMWQDVYTPPCEWNLNLKIEVSEDKDEELTH